MPSHPASFGPGGHNFRQPDPLPPRREPPPPLGALDAQSSGGAGQGFLTPFGQSVPQPFRGGGRDFIGGGRGASLFAQFQGQLNTDPGKVDSQIISAFPEMKGSVLNMSPFQKFMFMQRARRQNRRIKRGPGRPPRRPRLTNLPDFPSGTFDPNGPSIPRF